MLKLFTVIISALLGAGFGFLAKSYFTRLEFKQGITEAIVTRYLDARDKLSSILADCAVNANAKDPQWLIDKEKELSLIYFTYYDYFPQEVIRELLCLQSCLKSDTNHIYKIQNNELREIEKQELESFCQNIATCKNLVFGLIYNLNTGSSLERRRYRIQYQARHALLNINQYFTEENLTSLTMFTPKGNKNKTKKS